MAKIGLNNFRYATMEEGDNSTVTYGTMKTPAHAITCNVSVTNNDTKLYGDNVTIESDTSFSTGTVSIGIDEDSDELMATLLGHDYDSSTKTIVRKSSDTAPYVSFGRIVHKMVAGVRAYKVEFLQKVKFSEPSQEDNTKGENLEFSTTTIEGTIHTLADGTWSKAKTFSSEAEAKTFLEGLFTASQG